ncbi:hypothetical protein H310_12826 [Aphanomyces invadans]|uniref:Uncharacterized protein n=1 Tax=Aphanomyces invadans TaxID=157072 RepID=A0A024TG28_9STRA|nr:hypothetical protein H310_12826 [Aphanomyces invadans]ETV92988.1 hypothetical protein H310_12826 [Aphanomyces invadans]|eukprot:XP_008878253.1 hypothetical protein H310_12826 [Aphanomyces invadans]
MVVTQQYTPAYVFKCNFMVWGLSALLSLASPTTHTATLDRKCEFSHVDFQLVCSNGTVAIGSISRFLALVGVCVGSVAVCYLLERVLHPNLPPASQNSLFLASSAKYVFDAARWIDHNVYYIDPSSAVINGILSYREIGFERCVKEVCLYVKRVEDSMVLLTVYVDDITPMDPNRWRQVPIDQDSCPSSRVDAAKFREAGGHAVADDDIARCEAVADAFYKNPEDMDAFIEDILLMPHSQVYELTSIRQGKPGVAVGILVAPNLPPKTRFTYVIDKFIARLSLWCFKARTLAGKIAILHSICLPVLWYQLSFVPADKSLAKLVDNAMLQFLHGEEINPSSSTHVLRLIKKDIVFMSKHAGGLGLHHALKLWEQHNRAVMIRCVKAFAVPSSRAGIPSWITPGYFLLEKAFHPWGSPRDLLLACGHSPFLKTLKKSPNVTPMWSTLLSSWFEARWTPFGFPSSAPSWRVPLWHNSFLPGLENLYDHCGTSTQPQALTLASLGITQVAHLLTPCERLWPPGLLFDTVRRLCVRSNLEPPTKKWITILTTKLSTLFEVASESNLPPFHLPPRRPPLLEGS